MKLLLALAVIVVSEAAIRVVDHASTPTSARLPTKSLDSLPTSIGLWNSKDVELEPGMRESSGAAVMMNRCYRDVRNDQILLNAGIWTEYIAQVPHRPEVCYTNAGWEIEDRKFVGVPLDDTRSTTARLLTFNKHGQRILILYWVQLGTKAVLEDADFRRALQENRGANQSRPAAMKIMLQTDANDPAAAESRLIEFASQLAPFLDQFAENCASE